MFHLPDVAFILEKIRKRREINLGGGVFSYRYVALPEKSHISDWLFRFYDAVEFLTCTAPPPGSTCIYSELETSHWHCCGLLQGHETQHRCVACGAEFGRSAS